MMVPQTRLLQWIALVYLPFAIMAALIPAVIPLAAALILCLAMLAAADAIFSRGRLNGIRLRVSDILRMSVGRPGNISVYLEHDGMTSGQMQIGMTLPPGLRTPAPVRHLRFASRQTGASVEWTLAAERQGRYQIQAWHLEIPSRLGFWAVRQHCLQTVEVRVYPNLLRERHRLAALFMRRHLGLQAQRQIGKGREFDQLREYQPGDSYEDIHWKATAKRNQPITKVYQIERTQRIYTIIDASRLSARAVETARQGRGDGAAPERLATVLDRYVTAALIVALAAERQGDHFGLITFSDQVKAFIPAKNGLTHYNTCRDALYRLEAEQVSPDFAELFTFIGARLRRRAMLVFLTHMDDPVLGEHFASHVDLIARRHLVMVNMLKPTAAAPLFTSPDVTGINDVYRQLGGHLLWRRLEEMRRTLLRHGVGFAQLSSEGLCNAVVSQYLTSKQRQIL